MLRGPAFPSLREELRSNSTKQGRKKILIYRIFLLFFLDCSKASLLAMTTWVSTQQRPFAMMISIFNKQ
ncbi:MAG: hypothetical protein ACEY3D_01820 [Rickettsia sp.]|uniref:hypothetical protein n=1 Tax=Rickettsia sp. TaxID=789 RepID=UPI00397A9CD7